jgi:hypothetical protein
MNCNELSRWLDECESEKLVASRPADLAAHLAQCADCARQFRVSRRLLSFRSEIPPLPAALLESARLLDDARESAESHRRMRRPVIVGGLFLFGALATILATGPWRSPETAEIVD